MKKRILLLSFSHLDRDPRVKRQIVHLKEEYEITTIGLSNSGLDDIQHGTVVKKENFIGRYINAGLLLLRLYSIYLHRSSKPIIESLKVVAGNKYDLVIAHDKEMLFLSSYFKQLQVPFLYDAHEYTPRESESSFVWRVFFKGYYFWLCNKYLEEASHIITVSDGIAEEYARVFKIKKPDVITNSPVCSNTVVNKSKYPDVINILYHGGVNADRKIHNLIEAFKHVQNTHTLTFMLVVNSGKNIKYIESIKKQASGATNILFRDPVPQDQIIEVCAEYDAGIIFYEPVNFNIMHCLPNKFFEYIQARIPVIVSPLRELKSSVEQYTIGLVTHDFTVTSLVKTLKSINREKLREFIPYLETAALRLSGDENMHKLDSIMDELLKKGKN